MNNLYLGIKGHIVCIEKQSGKKLWDTKLKGMSITNLIIDNKYIYAYTSGHLFCIDADFGQILWKNTLSGYGYGSCVFAIDGPMQQQAYVVDHEETKKRAQSTHAASN